MSASLVGSEMCIRDRPSHNLSHSPTAAPGEAGNGGTPQPQGTPSGGEPVSYTHLTLPTICSV
eukprot:14500979-Alexandrium_andersonii.AAC.1